MIPDELKLEECNENISVRNRKYEILFDSLKFKKVEELGLLRCTLPKVVTMSFKL